MTIPGGRHPKASLFPAVTSRLSMFGKMRACVLGSPRPLPPSPAAPIFNRRLHTCTTAGEQPRADLMEALQLFALRTSVVVYRCCRPRSVCSRGRAESASLPNYLLLMFILDSPAGHAEMSCRCVCCASHTHSQQIHGQHLYTCKQLM